MTGTLERMAENARLEAMRQRALELQGQPTPPAPQGGVAPDPQAVDDLQARFPAMARGALDTATFGLSDELRGVIGAIDPNDTYQGARDDQRYRAALDRAHYPGARLAGQVAGGITAGLATAGPIDDALRLVPGLRSGGAAARMGRGALAGGLEGAAYGAGSGDEFDDRFSQALTYGGLGAAAGAAIPTTAEIVRRLVLRPAGGMLGIGNQSRAANSVIRALEDAGMTPDQIDDALRRAAAEGQDVFSVADVLGHTGRRSLAGVASQPGRARTLAEDALTGRQADQSTRLAQFVEEAMGADDTAAQTATANRVARGVEGNLNYGAARANAQPVDVRNVLSVIDDRIGPMDNTTIAGDGVDAALRNWRQRLAGTLQEGDDALPAELSDFGRVAGVRSDLSDAIEVASRAGRNNEARELRRVLNALDEALEEASPDYAQARDSYAAASRVMEASDAGRSANAPRVRYEDVMDRWNAMSPEERQAFRVGYADRDLGAIEGARDSRNMAGQLFNNTRQRQNYGLMADDADLFFRRVGREDTMSETRNAALSGSRTAELLADQAAANGEDISIIGNLLAGRPATAAGQVLGRAYNAAQGQNEATREIIARALLSRNPGEISRIIAPAQRNEAVNRLIAGLVRGGLREPTYQAVAR